MSEGETKVVRGCCSEHVKVEEGVLHVVMVIDGCMKKVKMDCHVEFIAWCFDEIYMVVR